MIRGWRVVLPSSALALVSPIAKGDDDPPCAAVCEDGSDRFAIGPWSIGSPADRIMSRAELDACSENNGLSDDCYYRSPDGTHYILWRDKQGNGRVANASLSRPAAGSADADNADGARPLSAGFAIGAAEAEVNEQLRHLPAEFAGWLRDPPTTTDPSLMLYAKACIRSSHGELWRLHAYFDPSGRLESISASQRDFTPIT